MDDPLVEKYREASVRLIAAALDDDTAWDRLGYMVDTFGPRLSGSQRLEQAIDWVLSEMEKDGLDNVRGEDVMVPHWVRGDESMTLMVPRTADLQILGLGGSIGTDAEGITGEVFVVTSFDDLKAHAAEAKGKIVLYNVPFEGYGRTVQYRTNGAVRAAEAGAVAALVRSVGPVSLYTPHTGNMHYDDEVEKIPTAAVTVEDAMMMQRMQDRGQRIVVNLKMGAQTLSDAPSRNVVAEVVGSEHPEQVVVLGGHIDSWDVGQGAMDDGGGAVAAWEAVRLIKALGLHPRRTVRVAMWTNEENGTAGGRAYRDQHAEALDDHILAIETDSGVFKPLGFGFTGSPLALAKLQEIGKLLDWIGAGNVTEGGGGADIGPMMREGVPGAGLRVDGEKYFWYHHTNADMLDKLDRHEVNLCVATLAVMAYVVADMEEPLPRAAEAAN